jgi:hypothetical protein
MRQDWKRARCQKGGRQLNDSVVLAERLEKARGQTGRRQKRHEDSEARSEGVMPMSSWTFADWRCLTTVGPSYTVTIEQR